MTKSPRLEQQINEIIAPERRTAKAKRALAMSEERRLRNEANTAWRIETIDQVRKWTEENGKGPWDDRLLRIVIRRLDRLALFVRSFFPDAGPAPFSAWDAAALVVLPKHTALRLARRLFGGGPGICKDLKTEDLTFNMDWFRPADFH